MLKSMTGFGKATGSFEGLDVSVEIKSVNHRYFEFSSRCPRAYAFLEDKLKTLCSQSISRGKIELSVFIDETNENALQVDVDREYAKAYIEALKGLAKEYKLKNDLGASAFVGNNDIFKTRRTLLEDEVVTNAVTTVAADAIKAFIEMRETEGVRLKEDVKSRANFILEKVSFIEEKAPETVKAYRERLEQKIKDLLEDAKIDEQRLITETAIFADKVAVDEETVRLRSHIKQLFTLLDADEPVGKKLDFIVQEMNRETNTIGSKAQNIEIAHTVVDIKSEIEKIREQIQNIE